MTFTDNDLRRLKQYIDKNLQNWRCFEGKPSYATLVEIGEDIVALCARLEAAEKLMFVPPKDTEEINRLFSLWRKAAGK